MRAFTRSSLALLYLAAMSLAPYGHDHPLGETSEHGLATCVHQHAPAAEPWNPASDRAHPTDLCPICQFSANAHALLAWETVALDTVIQSAPCPRSDADRINPSCSHSCRGPPHPRA